MQLKELFSKFGKKDLLEGKGREQIAKWHSWYKGKINSFHNYIVYNGENKIKRERLSLGMAKKVCEDWASLLLNEKTNVVLGDEASQKRVEQIFKDNEFWSMANEAVEKSFALSMGAFVVTAENMELNVDTQELDISNASVKINFFTADKIHIFSTDEKDVTECAFVTVDGDKMYISMHLIGDDGNYDIHNIEGKRLKSGNIAFSEDQVYTFHTGRNKPLFHFLKPNKANNLDINSCLGISIYANAIDTLKSIDLVYDSLANEFELGKKRIFVSAEAMKLDQSTGEQKFTFDPNDTVFYQLPTGIDDNLFVKETVGDLRVEAHINGLQCQLSTLSEKVGFGRNKYKFDKDGVSTATEVISENSDMFRNLKKHEIVIEKMIIALIDSIAYINNTFTTEQQINVDAVDIKFDDSIIEDKNTEMLRDMQLVYAGLMMAYEFRMKYFAEDEETAKKTIKENMPRVEF